MKRLIFLISLLVFTISMFGQAKVYDFGYDGVGNPKQLISYKNKPEFTLLTNGYTYTFTRRNLLSCARTLYNEYLAVYSAYIEEQYVILTIYINPNGRFVFVICSGIDETPIVFEYDEYTVKQIR